MSKQFDLLFTSSRFNLTEAREYFINDCCFGDDAAQWLGKILRSRGLNVTEPDQEDWGWYFFAEYQGRKYFVGVGGTPEESLAGNEGEWRLIVELRRTWRDKLTGANKMSARNAFLQLLAEILQADPEIRFVAIEPH